LDIAIGNFESDGGVSSISRIEDGQKHRGVFGEILEGNRTEN